jgi:two-component system, NtrC family, sensor kinase
MRLTQSVAFRLFLIIASVQTLVLGALTVATVNVHQTHLMQNAEVSAQRVSDVIARSAHYSMLLNRNDDVQAIVVSVGNEPGIEGIRIYNKAGRVVFATIKSDIHTTVDMNAEACVSCHATNKLDAPHPPEQRLSRILTKQTGEKILGLITPIRNEPQCSNAACHAHPPSKTILGVLDVKMSLAQVDRQLEESKRQLLMMSISAALVVSLASGVFLWFGLRRPVDRLMVGMQMVASGRLDHRLGANSNDELGRLAETFNGMTKDLELARNEITEWSNTLEQKVSEKTAAVEQAHRQLVRVEKMVSLGNLASSVAHELNNPLEGILTFAKLLIKRLKKSKLSAEEIKPYCDDLQLVADEALRCGNIVKNLLVFSRQSAVSLQSVLLSSIIDRCLLLMSHHAKIHGVELKSNVLYDEAVQCDPNQIQQALVALVVNAIDAIGPNAASTGSGRVEVVLQRASKPGYMMIKVSDNGMGMSDDVKAHIFEPFFTTKSEGKGVGLGLPIVFGIVQKHHGIIDVDSELEKGTIFTIELPLVQPQENLEKHTTMSAEGVQNGKS